MTMTEGRVAGRARHWGASGFTLIELLVVIAVLAILAAIVLFNVTGVKNRGSSAACSTDNQSVQTAVAAYLSDHGGTFAPGVVPDGATPVSMETVSGGSANLNATFGPLLVPQYLHSTTISCVNSLTIVDANAVDSSSGYNVAGS